MDNYGIIFDLDGTLVNTLGDIAHSMNVVLEKYGFPTYEVSEYRNMVGWGIKKLVEKAILDGHENKAIEQTFIQTLKNEMITIYHEDPVRNSFLYPGVQELLIELEKNDVSFALLSNKEDSLVRRIAEIFFPEKKFMHIQGYMENVPKKPDPASALAIAKVLGKEPEQTYFIGDSKIDINTAKAAGMRPVGVSWGFSDVPELVEAGAQLILRHPLDFFSHVS